MEFRLLGPVEVWHGGRRVDIGHAKQRMVLVVLLVEAGRPVPTGILIDRVWDHAPPGNALSVLYGYLARLRKALAYGGAALARTAGGYLVDVDQDLVDLHRFRTLLGAAESAGAAQAAEAVRILLDKALGLWRGTPFVDLSGQWVAKTRRALEDQRLSAVVARNDACLRTGRHADLVAPLQEHVAAYPTDERLVGQLMLALSRTGRTPAALAQYRSVCRRLREELGCEPGRALRDIHHALLRDASRCNELHLDR
jgi:DNA-binding SARP family transcriptional activator